MSPHRIVLLSALALSAHVHAQTVPAAPVTSGTAVVIPAFGEVKRANDEATVVFAVEEQDKDRAAATARVNRKMKEGTGIVRGADPQAELKTVGYYTYPVYPEVPDTPRPLANASARRVPIGWRVGQSLEATTRNLDALPKTVAAAQKVLNLNNIDYHLSPATAKQLDGDLIAATWRNLTERTAAIARAMGRSPADALVETADFEGSGRYEGAPAAASAPMLMRAKAADAAEMPVPSFEPGETTLQMRMVGKLRFR
jgi:predicted secreted protein